MGYLGRKLAGLSRQRTLELLLRSYADEWFAHYNYQLVANILRGHRSPDTISLLSGKSARSLERANRISGRILQLGGEPARKLGELAASASDKPFKFPERSDDVEGVLKAVLDAERTSIRGYDELARSASDDVVTHRLAVDFLEETLHGEEQLERLIGESAPAMDGTA